MSSSLRGAASAGDRWAAARRYVAERRFTIALIVIFSVGIFLRLFRLHQESFWLDECISVKVARLDLSRILTQHYASFHPPVFYLLLHFWIRAFGESEFVVRLLACIPGIITLFTIYGIGTYFFDRQTGVIAALVTAVSRFYIEFSQEARMYSLETLLAIYSMFFLAKLVREGRRSSRIWYVLMSSLLLYNHVSGVLIILAHNIFFLSNYLIKKRRLAIALKDWLFLQIITIVTTLPLFGLWFFHLSSVQRIRYWIRRPIPLSMVDTLIVYAGSFLVLALIFIVIVVPIVRKRRALWGAGGRNAETDLLLVIWFLTPIAVPFIISYVSAPLYNTKYTIAASPAFYLLAAKGIRDIADRYVKYVVIAIIIVLASLELSKYYTFTGKPQWRDVASFITANAHSGDLIAFNDRVSKDEIFNRYYFKRDDVRQMLFPGESPAPYILISRENVDKLFDAVKDSERTWLIVSHVRDPRHFIERKFSPSFNLILKRDFQYIMVFLIERKPARAAAGERDLGLDPAHGKGPPPPTASRHDAPQGA